MWQAFIASNFLCQFLLTIFLEPVFFSKGLRSWCWRAETWGPRCRTCFSTRSDPCPNLRATSCCALKFSHDLHPLCCWSWRGWAVWRVCHPFRPLLNYLLRRASPPQSDLPPCAWFSFSFQHPIILVEPLGSASWKILVRLFETFVRRWGLLAASRPYRDQW